MRKLLLASVFLGSLLSVQPVFAAETDRADAIRYVRENKIMADYQDGGFHPDAYVSRIDFTVTVVDALYAGEDFAGCFRNIASRLPPDFTKLYADAPKDSWFAKHLCVAMHAGLVNGNKDGSFMPYRAITVGEASKIMAKSYGLLYPSKLPTGRPWYESSMLALSLHGAIDFQTDAFRAITRGEMAEMFYRLRSQERFPESRIIGQIQAPSAASLPVVAVIADAPTVVSVDAAPEKTVSHRTTAVRLTRRTLTALARGETP